ncbi:hypothetical protein [Streptomyces sp. NBC_00425]|uniref:hypothetical protein n=1 Tax=Streptomyces sp. NBC_00425 TaxID=2975740 RepID=UPI002E1B1C2E
MTAPGDMDIVVPVREEATNQQLRYALRSWCESLPHRKVWVVGYRHDWLADDVGHIPIWQTGSKFENTTVAMRAACAHPEVSDRFVWCNDDTFTMGPLPDGMPVLHRGLVADVEKHYEARGYGAYLRGMRETRTVLAELGHPEPLSYELHVPMPVDKAGMVAALDQAPQLDGMHKRTLYGNLAGLGGEQIGDVKVAHRGPRGFGPESLFLSTMPDSFTNGHVGRFIRAAFPLPCRYERAGRR